MILGAIDVGSNSVKLLIAAVRGRGIRVVETLSAVTRLGGGLDRAGRISPAAQERTIATLHRFVERCRKRSVERLVAVGTEAVRIARNGRVFALRCRREAGVPLRILSGLEEAKLAFLGATGDRRERRIAALDIGGGSTELMVGAPGSLRAAVSLPLGAVRLTEACLMSDPPLLSERLSMLQRVNDRLARLPRPIHLRAARASVLLGIGGSCVNVARMLRPSGSPDERVVSLHALEDLIDRLAELPLARRKRVPGIDPDRADIIIAGARILAETMRVLEFDSFTATVHGVRRGLIRQLAAIIPRP